MHVVATAGHVDHGKSTLVRALTGQDPDRLEEEHARGLSIELGYCWTTLPEVGEVAFVDVPGHQRFITTTLAGLGPVPVVLFVVAADDPWMPQAAEHLAALDALGVSQGLLVITRADLADPGRILTRAREELSRTGLRDLVPTVVSARTAAGLDRLRGVLGKVLAGVPAPDPATDVRLWVDRRFHVHGTGTVVTGTLPAGTIDVGDLLEADGTELRVRGLQSMGTPRQQVSGPARVAVALGGRVPLSLGRGSTLVSPGAFWSTTVLDVRLGAGQGRDLPERPLLHVGSAAVELHARPLSGGFARLALPEGRKLPLRTGDRALLRDPGSRALWGVQVLDPMPPPLSRRGAAAARASALTSLDGSLASELAMRGLVRRTDLVRIGVPVSRLPDGAVGVGDWLVSPAHTVALRQRLLSLVEATSLAERLGVVAAAHALGLPDPALVSALVTPPLREENGLLLTGVTDGLPEELDRAVGALHVALGAAPFAAPDRSRLRELGLDGAALATLQRAGLILRLLDDVVLLPSAEAKALTLLSELPQPFTASQARQALGSSRRVVLPLLQHLDRHGFTVRLADDRRRVRTRE